MPVRLRLTGFLESFNGERCLLLQVQWKDQRLPFTIPPTLMASSLLRIPYHSPSGLPPSCHDLERSLFAAEFPSCVSRYLDHKIASFVLDLASAFAGGSPPSLYILAEIETQPQDDFYGWVIANRARPLMPRLPDPTHQPRGVPLRSRLFVNDVQMSGFMEVRETEGEDSSDQNLAGASLQAITKLRELKLEKEVSDIGDCSVCLLEMSSIKGVLATPCDHLFHAKCILHWMQQKNTCPLCRSKLRD